MPTCSFCKKNYSLHQGLTVFTIDSKTVYYCSGKCRKNAAMKRDPKKVNWVRKRKHGELTVAGHSTGKEA